LVKKKKRQLKKRKKKERDGGLGPDGDLGDAEISATYAADTRVSQKNREPTERESLKGTSLLVGRTTSQPKTA